MNALATMDKQAIADFCQRWHIIEFAVFGSVLRDDFNEDSDIDVLVTFDDNAIPGLFTFIQMAEELEKLLGREVDLLTKKSVEDSPNYIRRKEILSSTQMLYGA